MRARLHKPQSDNLSSNQSLIRRKVMPKLVKNKPGDLHEREANRAADEIVKKSSSGNNRSSASPGGIVQTKPLSQTLPPRVQLKEENVQLKEPEMSQAGMTDPIEKEGPIRAQEIQTKEEDVQLNEDGNEGAAKAVSSTNTSVSDGLLQSTKGSGSPLPSDTLTEMNSGFGDDFSDVRIHTDKEAQKMASEMGAQAFTHGNDIYFNEGKFAPESRAGKHLLAHELTHTIQQKGMVQQKVQRHMQDKYPWDGYVSAPISAALRKNPAKSQWIADIPKGTRLTVIGNSGNWIQVRVMVDGIQKTGYMSQELVSLSKTDGVANEMESMVGEKATWQGSGPSRFTGRPNTFVTWAEAKSESVAPPVTSVTVINCWEMILLAAYRSGAITWDFIHKLYLNTKGNWGDELPRRLTSGSRSAYDVIKKTPKPKRGELVFFNDASHVALATGSGDEILTFWPPPNTKFTGDKTIDAVKKSTIGALYTYMKKNYPSLGEPKVTIGTPIW